MSKSSFILYTDFRGPVDYLSDEDAGRLFKAIMAYADGEPVILDGMAGAAFQFIKPVMDKDREKYERICEKNRANGSRGGRPRKADPEPKLEPDDGGFEIFWKEYPRHESKATARTAFKKISRKMLSEVILPDLKKRKASEQWLKDGGAYVPYAATYLNKKRWEDPIVQTQVRGKRNNEYAQREISDEDFKHLFLDLDQDLQK